MKLGLVTIYQVPNYGSVLQAYATQFVLESMGAECNILNYSYPNEWHWAHGAHKPKGIRTFIRKFLPSKKNRVLESFRREYFHLTSCYKSLDQLREEDWSSYDAFIVGSDQVWNARFVLGDSVFMLSFVPNNKSRFSISSSFALKSLPAGFHEKYKKELSKFTALSVREENGVQIINEELNITKKVKVLLDPTLLVSKQDWLHNFALKKENTRKPYILLYMWTYAFEPRPYIFEVVKYFKQKYNCEVIALEGYTNSKDACGLEMQDKSSSTINEFMDLFANAKMVVTSSFHGTAFALNFGIPLISIIPDGNGDDRQSSLLKNVGCAHCAVNIGQSIKDINPFYDVDAEQFSLNRLREDNLSWIRENIFATK